MSLLEGFSALQSVTSYKLAKIFVSFICYHCFFVKYFLKSRRYLKNVPIFCDNIGYFWQASTVSYRHWNAILIVLLLVESSCFPLSTCSFTKFSGYFHSLNLFVIMSQFLLNLEVVEHIVFMRNAWLYGILSLRYLGWFEFTYKYVCWSVYGVLLSEFCVVDLYIALCRETLFV